MPPTDRTGTPRRKSKLASAEDAIASKENLPRGSRLSISHQWCAIVPHVHDDTRQKQQTSLWAEGCTTLCCVKCWLSLIATSTKVGLKCDDAQQEAREGEHKVRASNAPLDKAAGRGREHVRQLRAMWNMVCGELAGDESTFVEVNSGSDRQREGVTSELA